MTRATITDCSAFGTDHLRDSFQHRPEKAQASRLAKSVYVWVWSGDCVYGAGTGLWWTHHLSLLSWALRGRHVSWFVSSTLDSGVFLTSSQDRSI